ncbi:MAG TPA: non-heme iron oxygenase ferredoxin subunit [Candidatus Methanomethylicus sp.]|nr:non-heme iron oxygenase ferredoxin subunit [Candidatus Methanomethylicus sp.]HRR53739.1 non-heme iron oxygenase ferredoxin subunit [Candidatus Methanomethylicus sp.]
MVLIKVAVLSDLPPGDMKRYPVKGHELVVANVAGAYFAIAGNCTHAGADLSKGTVEGGVVTCPRHGSKFDIRTGKAISGPKIGFLKLKTGDAKTYRVKVDGNDLMVDLPDTSA